MSLNIALLNNAHQQGNKTICECPICAKNGGDKTRDHLAIFQNGEFACIDFPGAAGADHRRAIFDFCGIIEPKPASPRPAPAKLVETFTSANPVPNVMKERNWKTLENAAHACTPDQTTLEVIYRYPKNGKPFGATARYHTPDSKTFRQFHAIGHRWAIGAPSGKWPPYRENELPTTGLIDIFEGEKCVDTAVRLGMNATCSAGGAAAADRTDWQFFAGRDVRIWPDNNPAGEGYADKVFKNASSLNPPAHVKIVRLPGLPDGGDIVDFIEARDAATPEDLRAELEALADCTIPKDDVSVPLSLIEIANQPIDPTETLIGVGDCRWLERGAVAIMAALAGIGKSHLATQLATCWSCGRTAFGLPPVRPLRILILQAENPPNDSRAIAGYIMRGLSLTENERAAVHANTRQIWLPGCTGTTFLDRARMYLAGWTADLVFIDPLSSFAPGDLVKPEIVQSFCRAGLSALANDCHCGLFILHHTPKPNSQRDPSKMGVYDHQYSGAGAADLVANWPRAVLTMQALERGKFILRAAKRRPPWATEQGEQLWMLGMKHTDSGIWEQFEVLPGLAEKNQPGKVDVLAFVPTDKQLSKDALISRAQIAGIGEKKTRRFIAELIEDGALHEWRIPRPKTNPLILLSHIPQPQPELKV